MRKKKQPNSWVGRRHTRLRDRCQCDKCRTCKTRETKRKWYERNKERVKARSRAYHEKNRDEILVRMRAGYWDDREHRREAYRKWFQDKYHNDPEWRAAKLEYWREYRRRRRAERNAAKGKDKSS